MDSSKKTWKQQTKPFNNDINDALQQQHHAAQFIAMVGRHLIPQQADDSNTNMEYIPDEHLLFGNSLPNNIRVTLQLAELKLLVLDKVDKPKKVINLDGKTKKEVFVELSQNLADVGIDVSNLKNELHYEIPSHPLDEGAVFSVKDKKHFVENTGYRHNAKIVLNEIADLFEQEEPIRIWPHHFDTGAFYVISKNEKEEATQTIGIGFAIPDSMIDEPYFYLSFWSADPMKGLDKFPTLETGDWMMPNWNGAVLRHSEILKADSANGQYELVKSFYQSGIKMLIQAFQTGGGTINIYNT